MLNHRQIFPRFSQLSSFPRFAVCHWVCDFSAIATYYLLSSFPANYHPMFALLRVRKGRFTRYHFVAYNKLTTGLRHDYIIIFARISKFRCFHETKQTQNEVERFFLQLGRICFRILLRQQDNFSDFYKVLSQFAFRNMIVSFYKSSSARALKLPSISHTSCLT